jgi:hypothetical protein
VPLPSFSSATSLLFDAFTIVRQALTFSSLSSSLLITLWDFVKLVIARQLTDLTFGEIATTTSKRLTFLQRQIVLGAFEPLEREISENAASEKEDLFPRVFAVCIDA